MKKGIKLFAITVTGLAVAFSVTETWSKGVTTRGAELDHHRVGVVEQIYTASPMHMSGHNQANTWAKIAVADPGYGFVGHVSAMVPAALHVHSGDKVEVALSQADSDTAPDRVVRVLGH